MSRNVRLRKSANKSYRLGICATAEAICLREPSSDVDRPRLTHLSGLLAARAQRDELAVALLKRAAAMRPQDAACYAYLAVVLLRTSGRDQALGAALYAIVLAPRDAEVWTKLGRVLYREKLASAASIAFHEALKLGATRARIYGELGDAQIAHGQVLGAISSYETEVRLSRGDADALARLGNAWLAADGGRCLAIFQRATARYPRRATLRVGLGMALLQHNRQEDAVYSLRAALTLDPGYGTASRYLARTLERLHRPREAVDAWLAHVPALEKQQRFEEIDTILSQILILRPTSQRGVADVTNSPILARKPDSLKALLELAALHVRRREPRVAIQRLEEALTLEPDCCPAHNKLGSAAQLVGNFDRAYREFARGSQPRRQKARMFEQPAWDGTPLEGRTLLLWRDAGLGLGDTIQLVRYVECLDASHGAVLAECDRRLAPLLERVRGMTRVVTSDGPAPDFDLHAPFASLPLFARKGLWPPPASVPYLNVDRRVSEWWRQSLGGGCERRIGLSWGGTPTHRDAPFKFLPLVAFAPLAAIPNLRIISLQLGPQSEEAHACPAGLHVERLLHEGREVERTAGLILNLDLVITVDTMIAHLAGALGKPVWLLLAHAADTRWQTADATPWYPTTRIFRQASTNDWSGVLERVVAAMRESGSRGDSQDAGLRT